MAWGQKKSGGGGAGRLALIVAILALAVAWAAYRRGGGEIGTLWDDLTRGTGRRVNVSLEDGSDTVERQSDLARAQARLLGRRAEVAGERNLQQVRRDVEEVRANLERSYRNAGTKDHWRDLDRDLEHLQTQLREGSSKALATLDSALVKIKAAAGQE
jgi:hypothetical protein